MPRNQLYILPLLLFIFALNYHFFDFYNRSYQKAIRHFSGIENSNTYEKIQSEHPYYEIYQIAQAYKGHEERIVLVYTNREPEHLDYTSTYYANARLPEDAEPVTVNLTELMLFIDYYFYPHKIPVIDLSTFESKSLQSGDIIISDTFLDEIDVKNIDEERLIRIERLKKEPLQVNRHEELSYYIFQVDGANL